MTDIIQIPRFVEGKVFYNDRLADALSDVVSANYDALFMNELFGLRAISDEDSLLWNQWYSTPSVRVTGKTKQGSKVVVYAHVPNYFSNPKNIAIAIGQGLRYGAGRYPEKDFHRLLDMVDNENVFVVDYDTLRASPSDVIHVSKALEHPQVIPFIGGQSKAEKYLAQHEKVVGSYIGIGHRDDLGDVPYGRVLFVYGRSDCGNLVGDIDLSSDGRFVGVPSSAIGGASKIVSPLEKLVGKGHTVEGTRMVLIDDPTPAQYRLLTQKE